MLKNSVVVIDEDPRILIEAEANAAPARKRGRPFGSKTKSLKTVNAFTVSDFSFVRAVLQGINLKAAADRYLISNGSISAKEADAMRVALYARIVASAEGVIASMPTETVEDHEKLNAVTNALRVIGFASEGKVQSTSSLATSALKQEAIPTLDQFVADEGLDADFYSERELLELYTERWGDGPARFTVLPESTQSVDHPSIAQVVSALGLLQAQVSVVPQPTDAVDVWFSNRFAASVRVHGVLTLWELASWVNLMGRAWYTRLPGFGKTKAARINQWLFDNEGYTSVRMQDSIARTLLPRTPLDGDSCMEVVQRMQVQSFGLVPLGELAWPAELLGTDGLFRSHVPNTLKATNDLEAVHAWFAKHADHKVTTLMVYRRAIERLVLWSIFERRLPLSSLGDVDLIAFKDFLSNPPEHWIARRIDAQAVKGSNTWRPMRGPLSAESLNVNMSAVSKMYGDWHAANYITGNPTLKLSRRKRKDIKLDVMRALSSSDLGILKRYFESIPSGAKKNRLLAIFSLLLTTGLRADEAINLTWKEVEITHDGLHSGNGYVLRVLGKGSVERLLPLRSDVFNLLLAHREDRILLSSTKKLSSFSAHTHEAWPLIGILDEAQAQARDGIDSDYVFDCAREANTTGALSYQRLGSIVKATLIQAAKLGADEEADVTRLKSATVHWLRHTFAHLILDATNKDLPVTQQLLGHESITTTALYVKAELGERIKAVSKITGIIE